MSNGSILKPKGNITEDEIDNSGSADAFAMDDPEKNMLTQTGKKSKFIES